MSPYMNVPRQHGSGKAEGYDKGGQQALDAVLHTFSLPLPIDGCTITEKGQREADPFITWQERKDLSEQTRNGVSNEKSNHRTDKCTPSKEVTTAFTASSQKFGHTCHY